MRQKSRPWAFADLFSGCGGLSAGLLQTERFAHLYAADSDEWANATYEANLGFRPDSRDLLTLADPGARQDWAAEVRSGLGDRQLLLAGGPPCQGFSSHVKVQGDRLARNQLFTVFGALAVELMPDVIMIENVADLVAARSWTLFSRLRARLEEAGYIVRARILNVAQLGVPQERFRTVVLASRNGEVLLDLRKTLS
jgi:DNA (cytosine-5)-methyltransferase 1